MKKTSRREFMGIAGAAADAFIVSRNLPPYANIMSKSYRLYQIVEGNLQSPDLLIAS